jgi:hypothetical protein
MKPEKQQLLHDLLADENRCQVTLLAGGQILRQRRRWRALRRFAALLLAMTGLVLFLVGKNSHQSNPAPSMAAAKPQSPVEPQVLNDNELLSLFPNTPVGLATLPNGKKLLIFPRPEDEKRFFTRI